MFQFIIFDYDNNWMILLYENGKGTEYWCNDEHSWDNVWKVINITKQSNLDTEIIHIKCRNDEYIKYNIFNLTEKDIEELRLLS